MDWEQIFSAVPQINLNSITIQFIPACFHRGEPKTMEAKQIPKSLYEIKNNKPILLALPSFLGYKSVAQNYSKNSHQLFELSIIWAPKFIERLPY